jgi:hypothetical protein
MRMRILIAYEESHYLYSDAMESAIRILRPQVEVRVARLRELEAEVGRFEPHLVVSSRPNTVDPGGMAAWYELSHEPDEPSKLCLNGQRWEVENPGLEVMLEIIDETERLLREERDLGDC